MPFRCGAALPGGRACQTAERAADERCWRHRGAANAAPVPTAGSAPDARLAAIQANIDEVVGGLAVWQRYIGEQLSHVADGGEPPSEDWIRLVELYSLTAGRLGRLMRDRRALQGEAADGLVGAIAQALDELRTEMGWDV